MLFLNLLFSHDIRPSTQAITGDIQSRYFGYYTTGYLNHYTPGYLQATLIDISSNQLSGEVELL